MPGTSIRNVIAFGIPEHNQVSWERQERFLISQAMRDTSMSNKRTSLPSVSLVCCVTNHAWHQKPLIFPHHHKKYFSKEDQKNLRS